MKSVTPRAQPDQFIDKSTLSKGKRGALIIKSISAKQRPRRPAAAP
jgi:hypothetical protein